MLTVIWTILKYLLILILPFLMLIRGSIFIHTEYALGAYLSLAGGLLATTVLLFLYMTFVYAKFTKKIGDEDNLQRRILFAFLLVVSYCAYGLFFISADNFKNPIVKWACEPQEIVYTSRSQMGMLMPLTSGLIIEMKTCM